MDLFTYLMAKNGHNTSIHEDLFSYLLGKSQGGGGEIKTATGVTIYIPDAKKLVSFMMTKESTQDGTPTPESPVEVKTVKGYINEKDFTTISYVQGNNATVTRNNGEYTINAPNQYSNARFNQSQLNLKPSTTYTFYAKVKETNASGGSCVYVESELNDTNYGIWGNRVTTGNISSVTFTTPTTIASDSSAYIGLYPREGNTTATFTDVILVEGSDVLPYVPYGNNYIYTKVVGKNLFDGQIELGGINLTTGENVANNYRTRSKNYIEVQPNTTYTFTKQGGQYRHILEYGKNKNYLSTEFQFVSNNYTFTTNDETYYIRWYDTSYRNTSEEVQIEEGTTATTYEAYKERTTTIPLNNNEIVGIGDYKDELLVDKSGHVFINKKTGKQIFNGSENWVFEGGSTSPTPRTTIKLPYGFSILNNNYLSNYFIQNSTTSNRFIIYLQTNVFYISLDNTISGILDTDTNNEKLQKIKNWLSTHNTELYYIRKNENLIDLQTTVDLKLFKGVNNVSNSVDGYMTIEYK